MRRSAPYLLLLGLSCHTGMTLAAPSADFVDVGVLSDVVFAAWAAGDGDQVAVQLHCIASADTSKPNPAPKDQASQYPYNFRISDLGAPAGYYLYLNGDDTATGNARVAVQFQHRDVLEGTGFELLSDGGYDIHPHLGQFKNCSNGNNSEVTVTLNSTDLSVARGGTYTGSFRAEIRGGGTGTMTASVDFQVSITIASQVRISALDNVDLGGWMGVGGLTATETFCVYSNNAAAGYSITISSPGSPPKRS
ncbi:MAG: hypothetical protein HUJ31_19680, partial [Pseudomonadales bacterium]|nr:hypothetical protein [Pseudomonadales bacterium]